MDGSARICVGDRGLNIPYRHEAALRVRCGCWLFHWVFGRSINARGVELIRLASKRHCIMNFVSQWINFELLIFVLQLFQQKLEDRLM